MIFCNALALCLLCTAIGLLKQIIDTSEFIMDIKGNSLYAQMQSMAVEATGNRLPTQMNTDVNQVSQVNNSGSNFANLLSDAVNKVNEVQKEAGDKRTAFELGDQSVTLAETMIAAQKASVAFDATVQVRNKFVEAYKEIMSMPV